MFYLLCCNIQFEFRYFFKIKFCLFLEKLEGDSKSNQVDERNISRNIEPGNIEPITEGTVMIVRSQNQMK